MQKPKLIPKQNAKNRGRAKCIAKAKHKRAKANANAKAKAKYNSKAKRKKPRQNYMHGKMQNTKVQGEVKRKSQS